MAKRPKDKRRPNPGAGDFNKRRHGAAGNEHVVIDFFTTLFDRLLGFPPGQLPPGQPEPGQHTPPAQTGLEIDREDFELYREVVDKGFRYTMARYHPEGKEPHADKIRRLTALRAQFKERGIL